VFSVTRDWKIDKRYTPKNTFFCLDSSKGLTLINVQRHLHVTRNVLVFGNFSEFGDENFLYQK
jgi:hypothetical protein